MGGYFDPSPPHPLERLAKREGESNLYALLAGREAGGDTTAESFCLAVARRHSGDLGPEALETHWAMADRYRASLCRFAFARAARMFEPKYESWQWLRGAVLDAYTKFRTSRCAASESRAKQFGVRKADYLKARNFAEAELVALQSDAGTRWMRALFD